MYKRTIKHLTVILFIMFGAVSPVWGQSEIPEDYKLTIKEPFRNQTSLNTMELFPSGQWLTAKQGESGKCLKYVANDKTPAADIRPVVKGIIKNRQFNSFILELDVEQCGRDYNCRDFCLIFDFKDEENYAFVHFASVANEACHGIFTVQLGKLMPVSDEVAQPVSWGITQWHKIRMEAGVEHGKVKVWFDGKLLWNLNMPNKTAGRIGFGAPDGAAKIDNLKIWTKQLDE